MSINDRVRVQEYSASGVFGGRAGARLHEAQTIAVGGRAAPFVRVQESDSVFVGDDQGRRTVVRVEEVNVVFVGALGVIPEQPLEVNAFEYNIDGHIFYGLHVRDRGTFLFDAMSNQWAQWQSGDLPYWNAQFHVEWKGDFYAGSLIDNAMVRINPDSVLDDSFRTNLFQATGRLESKSRRWIKNPEAHLFGSVGLRGGDIALRYSEDEGLTWSFDRVVNVAVGDRDMNVMFYDMGSVKSPGRIYQIEDEGTMRRIQTLQVKLGDGDQ